MGMIIAVIIILLSILILPFFMAWGLTWDWLSFAKGPNSAWIGFWGSYLGGLISGVITFVGVYFGFKLQDNKNRIAEEKQKTIEIFKNYADVYTVFQWCEDMIKYLDGRYTWDTKRVFEITDKARESNKALLTVDIVWHKKLKDLLSESFEITGIINKYGLEKFQEQEMDSNNKYKKKIEEVHLEILQYIKINL